MADDPDNSLGTLGIGITADYSDLEAKLQGAEDAAAAAGKEISDALNSAVPDSDQLSLFAEQAATAFGELSEQMSLVDAQSIDATEHMEQLGSAAAVVGPELEAAAVGAEASAEGFGLAAVAAETAAEGFAVLVEHITEMAAAFVAFEAIVDAVKEAVGAFAELQSSSVALGLIEQHMQGVADATGQVNEAMEKLEGIATSDALSFPSLLQAQQKLAAIGTSLEDMPAVLQGVADGAATMGASFDTAAQSLERIEQSGALSGRTLINLGLQIDDVSAAMDQGDLSLVKLKADFLDLEPATRGLVIALAEQEKNAGAAAAQAGTLAGQWQLVKTQIELAGEAIVKSAGGFDGLGAAAVIAMKAVETVVEVIVTGFKLISDLMSLVLGSIGDAVVGVLAATKAVASGDLTGAINALKTAGSSIASDWNAGIAAIVADNANAGATIKGIWASTGQAVSDPIDAAALKIQVAQQIAAAEAQKAAEAAQKAAVAFNKSWDSMANAAESAFAQMDSGDATAASAVSKLDSAITKATTHFTELTPASAAMLATLTTMYLQAKQAEDDLANTEALDKLIDQMGQVQVQASLLADKVPVDFQKMLEGVSAGFNFSGLQSQLQNSLTTLTADLQKIPAEMQPAMQVVIDKTKDALNNLTDMNSALKLLGQDKAMDGLAQQLTGLENTFGKGLSSEAQFDQGMTNLGVDILKTVIPAMEKGIPVTQSLLDALQKGGPVGQQFADNLTNGLDNAVNKFTAFAETVRAQSLTVDNALKDLGVQSLDATAAAMQRDGDDIIAILKGVADASSLTTAQFTQDQNGVIASATKMLAIWQTTGQTINDDVLNQIAKIAPALALAAKDGPDAFADALEALKTKASDAIMTLAQAYTTLGVQSSAALDNILSKQTAAYNLLVSANAPIQAQLQGLSDIYATQIKIAQATGASGEATLQWTQALAGVQSQQAAITQQTMALSNLYTAMLKDFNADWLQLGNSIGDAIVSGQNFGAAFTKVFDDLKKQLADLVVNYLLGQLKTALLADGDLMKDFNSVFNAIFGASGTVAQGLQQTQKLVGQAGNELDDIYTNTSKQMTQLTSQTVQGIQQTGQAALSQLSSILNMVSGIVTAIASVISAIEIARTNTILGHIEDNTRDSAILDGQILEMIHDVDNQFVGFNEFVNGALTQYLQNINVDLDELVGLGQKQADLLATINTNGGSSGGGGSSLAQTVTDLAGQVTAIQDVLKQGIESTGVSTQATTDATSATTDLASSTTDLTDATTELTPQIANLAAAVTTSNNASNPNVPSSGILSTANVGSVVDIGPNGPAAALFNLMQANQAPSAPNTNASVGQLVDIGPNGPAAQLFQLMLANQAPSSPNSNSPVTANGSALPLSATDLENLAQFRSVAPVPGTVTNYGTPGSPTANVTGGLAGGSSSTVTVPVTVSGNMIGTQQIANQLTNQIQANVVAALRQAGLKI